MIIFLVLEGSNFHTHFKYTTYIPQLIITKSKLLLKCVKMPHLLIFSTREMYFHPPPEAEGLAPVTQKHLTPLLAMVIL